ncbi:MAG: GntR family transcriptional regulator [Candidatus Omnitrophota bacterium]
MEKETYTVNLNSAVALPFQIKEDLLSKINAGCPGPEKKILSEIKLAKLYGVSRMTVRQAIIELGDYKGFGTKLQRF